MDCRMQRELVDIVLEAVGEFPDLPETIVTALVEGAHILGGTHRALPLTDSETDAVVQYLKRNMGSTFNENEIRAEIAKHPGRFQQTLMNIRHNRNMPTRAELDARQQNTADRQKAIADSKVNRFKYYNALVSRIKKSFAYYNIPFDEKKAMDEIAEADRRWLSTNILSNVANNPSFVSLGAAMKDSAASFLRKKNPALGKFIQDAFNFRNMRENELEQKKAEYSYMRPGEGLAASGDNAVTEERGGNAEYNNQIAPWFGEGKSIGEVAAKCPEVPYSYLYTYFVDHGGVDMLQNAPKPDEDLMSFLTRLQRGDASEMDFTEDLYRSALAAYGSVNLERILKGFVAKHQNEYNTALEKCSHGWVKPKALPVYAVWSMLH